MSIVSKTDNSENRQRGSRFTQIQAAIPIAAPIVIALAIALSIYGLHLFDLAVPIEEDVRAHIFKIDILHIALSNGSWPQWIPYWYHGFPAFQYYPPGFYFLGAILTFVFKHAVISYKFLLLLTLMSNGLVAYYFARRFLKFDLLPSLLCLIAYESSTPLLVNYLYGTGPNLLGWSVSLLFLTIYLCNVTEDRIYGLKAIALPGLLFGVTMLIHPFPAIFAILAIIVFHIIWLAHSKSFRISAKSQLLYFIAVFGIAGLIAAHYWLPVLLTQDYASPIYTFTKDAWKGGTPYLIVLTVLALAIGVIIRRRIKSEPKLDLLIAYILLTSALGFGASRYLPFGLGSLVHEFRFATIMAPFFGILLIAFLLNCKPPQIKKDKLAVTLIISACLVTLIWVITKWDFIISYISLVSALGFEFSDFLRPLLLQFLQFAIIILPFSVILLVALSPDAEPPKLKRHKLFVALATSACLILIVSILPFLFTYKQANLSRLFRYTQNYQQAEYTQLLQSAKDGRLIVPVNSGYLIEGDSPVTFGWYYGVETVNGPYNQGDPKFFKHTVHLEWEERWLGYEHTRENLMQESAAKYIFIRSSRTPLANTDNLKRIVDNSYGQLWELDQSIVRALKVTPILLDVKSPEQTTGFFNILLPKGYRMVFVNIDEVPEDLEGKFDYVMLDDESKISHYEGKVVFLLNNVDGGNDIDVAEEGGTIKLSLPYITYTNEFFYRGDKGDVKEWRSFDSTTSAQLDENAYSALQRAGEEMNKYLDKLNYEPAGYKFEEGNIEVSAEPGFTLIKDSFFPYWNTKKGEILSTSQGFMLVHSDDATISLNYRKPAVNTISTMVSIIGLAIVTIMLATIAILSKWRARRKQL